MHGLDIRPTGALDFVSLGARGYGVRAPVVFYKRSTEAAARLEPGDFDWAAIFRGGVR
jgi:hypothetical protein